MSPGGARDIDRESPVTAAWSFADDMKNLAVFWAAPEEGFADSIACSNSSRSDEKRFGMTLKPWLVSSVAEGWRGILLADRWCMPKR